MRKIPNLSVLRRKSRLRGQGDRNADRARPEVVQGCYRSRARRPLTDASGAPQPWEIEEVPWGLKCGLLSVPCHIDLPRCVDRTMSGPY